MLRQYICLASISFERLTRQRVIGRHSQDPIRVQERKTRAVLGRHSQDNKVLLWSFSLILLSDLHFGNVYIDSSIFVSFNF